MKKLLQGWIFYTAVLLFLTALILTAPKLCQDFFGTTDQAISQAAAQLDEKAVTAWGQYFP